MGSIEASGHIVGREAELGVLREFLAGAPAAGGLVLVGGPGIGKTTLWEAGLETARDREMRVLRARPTDGETKLAFTALADLLDGLDIAEVAGVPAPQRRALEVALLRADSAGPPAEQRAISLGLLNVLRGLADREPLLVAIDDVQWLDPASADALAFSARRLEDRPVRYLLARRSGASPSIERELASIGLERLELGGLSLGAIRRMLAEQLGLVVSRRVLRRIFTATDGNPLFVLELGRALAERGPLEIGAEIPLTVNLDELLGARVEQLTEPVRGVLLAAALSGPATARELSLLADRTDLDDAVDSGLLVVEGDLVRVSHPLLAAAVRARSTTRERRRIHAELARSATNGETEARHLALAAAGPDAVLAVSIDAAAAHANARGAVEDAIELAEHALRLSPFESDAHPGRVLALGDYLYRAGELQRLNSLLAAELEALPPGAARARAHLLLSFAPSTIAESNAHLEQALVESAAEPLLRAKVLAEKSEELTVYRLERLPLAEQWALEGLRLAGRDAGADVVQALGWVRILRGRPIDDLLGRSGAAVATPRVADGLERLLGIRLAFRGQIAAARETFVRLLAMAEERGDDWSADGLLHQLCELELRAGNVRDAAGHFSELDHSLAAVAVGVRTHESRLRALLAAVKGLPIEAERFATATIAGTETTGAQWDRLEALRARGIAALCAGEPARAVESLRTVWEHSRREGIDDPGAFPVAPELVEALVETGETEEAGRVTARLREQAEEQEHPWALVTAKRCRGLVQITSRVDIEGGAARLLEASGEYAALGLRLDAPRSLLALGRAQRRLRKWGAARTSLEQAAAEFDEIGADGWSQQARSELARVGGRRPQSKDKLTSTERRTAELAAEGLSNKEIAAKLFVTVHTVEVHLSHAYAKLGVRSRSQLPRHLTVEASAPTKD